MNIGDQVYYAYRQSCTDDGELKLLDYATGWGRIVSYDDGPTVVIDYGLGLAYVEWKHVHKAKHMVDSLCEDLNAKRETVGFSRFYFPGDAW